MSKSTSRVKFVTGLVQRFKCDQSQRECLIWDTDEKTLCLRARASGAKAFYFQGRYNKRVLKIKIGDTSDRGVTIDFARKEARKYQYQIDSGLDPRVVRDTKAQEANDKRENLRLQSVRLADLWGEYISANQMHWSPAYKHDHDKAMQKGGRARKRSKKKTTYGVLYELSNVRLQDINAQLLISWMAKERVSRPTVAANGYRILRAALNWADGTERYEAVLKIDKLFKNKELKRMIPRSKPRQDVLLQQHLPAWFHAVDQECDEVIAAYLKGLLLTGARREELAQLRWSDVNMKWASIRLKDKVEGERYIPLTKYMKYLIQGLPEQNEWVYSSLTSRSGRLVDPYRAHKRALDSESLPHITLHGLRRSFGTLSEWVECPTGITAQLQGHKPSALIERHYRVRSLDLLEVWHQKIETKILEFAKVE